MGWLRPKGGKKSFCILARNRFAWFKSAEDHSEGERGSVVLDGCAVRKDANNQFTIYSPANPSLMYAANLTNCVIVLLW